jgi:hypothetical protein
MVAEEELAASCNSTSGRWASASSTGRNCHRYSGRGKSRACRNNTNRRCRSSLEHPEYRRSLPSDHKSERCCWAADDIRAESHTHANDRWAACERAPRAQWPAAATKELQSIMCATSAQHTPSATRTRHVAATPQSLSRIHTADMLQRENDPRIRRGKWSLKIQTPRLPRAKYRHP